MLKILKLARAILWLGPALNYANTDEKWYLKLHKICMWDLGSIK